MRNIWIMTGIAVLLSSAAVFVATFALVMYGYHDHEEKFDNESIHLIDRGEFTADMVLDAIERYDKEGRAATIDYYNSPKSANGEWYVFIIDEDDKIVAHADRDLLGEDLKGDIGVDSTGYRFGTSLLEAGPKGHWVDYLFANPVTGNVEYKHSWVVKRDGLTFGSGWYQILPKSS